MHYPDKLFRAMKAARTARITCTMGAVLAGVLLQVPAFARGSDLKAAVPASVHESSNAGTVLPVADPTGDPATDRANIEAAIALARPGDTVLFAPGTYVIGLPQPSPAICVPVADVTLRGSIRGTTIHGGEVVSTDPLDGFGFFLGGATVQRLTFESFNNAIVLGFDCDGNLAPNLGGYTIADNVFKSMLDPVLGVLHSINPTRITRNQFINTTDAYDLFGGIVHVSDNAYRAPRPNAIPIFHKPLSAGILFGGEFGVDCNDNVIEGNSTDGNVDGFVFVVTFGGACNRNIVRNNTFTHTAPFDDGDVGTMVLLINDGGVLADNLVEGNVQDGTSGYGIVALNTTTSTFVGNVIRGVRMRPNFLGRGGVGILLLQNSAGNSLSANRLEANQFCDVLLRSHTFNNIVLEPNDSVLDRGRRNLVHSDGSCGAEGAQAEENQLGIPAKIEMLLGKVKRGTSIARNVSKSTPPGE